MNTTAIRGCRWSLVYAGREGITQDAGETWEECLDAAQEMFRDVHDLDWRPATGDRPLHRYEFFLVSTGKVVAKAYFGRD